MRENTLTESVLTIALTKCPTFLNGKTGEEMEGVLMDNRGKTIAFGPDAVFMIPEHHNLIVNTHIVGIALGTPFSIRA
jgi:hypothetical protein